jgi:hypothetical protein
VRHNNHNNIWDLFSFLEIKYEVSVTIEHFVGQQPP